MKITSNDVPVIIEQIEIIAAREGIKKKDLYDKSGVSSAAYSKWNTGATIPTLRSIAKIANVLGVDVTELVRCPENIKKESIQKDELIKRLDSIVDNIDLDNLQRLVKIAETLEDYLPGSKE